MYQSHFLFLEFPQLNVTIIKPTNSRKVKFNEIKIRRFTFHLIIIYLMLNKIEFVQRYEPEGCKDVSWNYFLINFQCIFQSQRIYGQYYLRVDKKK